MLHDRLVEAVMARTGLPGRAEAERAIEDTLAALAPALAEDDRRALRAALPVLAATALEGGAGAAAPTDPAWGTLEGLATRLAVRTTLPPGRALELGEAVLRAVAETIDADVLTRIRRHLDRSFEPHLSVPAAAAPPAPGAPPPAPAAHTLASGRPGSAHPLSEARPDVAHAHSVARSDDPHGDTKLSGARGLTQERLGETLADAPGVAGRKLSG